MTREVVEFRNEIEIFEDWIKSLNPVSDEKKIFTLQTIKDGMMQAFLEFLKSEETTTITH